MKPDKTQVQIVQLKCNTPAFHVMKNDLAASNCQLNNLFLKAIAFVYHFNNSPKISKNRFFDFVFCFLEVVREELREKHLGVGGVVSASVVVTR